MSSDDLAARAARHQPTQSNCLMQHIHSDSCESVVCRYCSSDEGWSEWPCDAHQLAAALAAEQEKLRMLQQAYDDTRTGTEEFLGELLAGHQIAPEPCGHPDFCVLKAVLAIGQRLTELEQRLAAEQAARTELSEAFVTLRWALRDMLHRRGVRSNPAVGDDWIVDELARLLGCGSTYAEAERAMQQRAALAGEEGR